MKGFVIHQTTKEYFSKNDINKFAIVKKSENKKGLGTFSRILGFEINYLWNSTILELSSPTDKIKKPFRMEFK